MLNLRLQPDFYKKLKEVANKEGKSPAAYVIALIRNHLESI